MSRFIESIKVENQEPFLIDLHQKRLEATFSHFGKPCTMQLTSIFKKMEHDEDGLYKWRIVYDLDNNYRIQMIPYAFPEIEGFQIVENNGIDYSFKYEDRKEIDNMKLKAKTEEIIIVKDEMVTDASAANLLFLKGEKWYTPSTYLLNGTQRQNLLSKGKITETEISLQNIREFSHFQIINAMNTMDNDFIYPIERIVNLPQSATEIEL